MLPTAWLTEVMGVSVCVEAVTLDDLLRGAFENVLSSGGCDGPTPTRGRNREVIGARLELTNPRARLSRSETRRRAVSAIAELCWYLRGTNSVEPIAFWVPKYSDEAENDGTVHGGYGPRLFGEGPDAQVRSVIGLLRESPGSRRAVIQLFDRNDIAAAVRYRDVPCTCTIQLLQRGSRLSMVVSMRSSDAYLGLPHDIFAFTMLQEIVARALGVELGSYVHLAGSLHIYDRDAARARIFLAEGWQSTTDPMPPMPGGSQWANIREMLDVEEQMRTGIAYDRLGLPNDPYWADLARVLALYLARQQGEHGEAHRIAADLTHEAFSTFAGGP